MTAPGLRDPQGLWLPGHQMPAWRRPSSGDGASSEGKPSSQLILWFAPALGLGHWWKCKEAPGKMEAHRSKAPCPLSASRPQGVRGGQLFCSLASFNIMSRSKTRQVFPSALVGSRDSMVNTGEQTSGWAADPGAWTPVGNRTPRLDSELGFKSRCPDTIVGYR